MTFQHQVVSPAVATSGVDGHFPDFSYCRPSGHLVESLSWLCRVQRDAGLRSLIKCGSVDHTACKVVLGLEVGIRGKVIEHATLTDTTILVMV